MPASTLQPFKKPDCGTSRRSLFNLLTAVFGAKCSYLDFRPVQDLEPQRFQLKDSKKCWYQKATVDDCMFMRAVQTGGKSQPEKLEAGFCLDGHFKCNDS